MLTPGGFLTTTAGGAGTGTGGGTSSGASGGAGGGGGGESGGGGTPGATLSITTVKRPPRFREVGVAIGDAVDVQASGSPTFPLSLTLNFDPLEPYLKGVPPELIRVFFFNEQTKQWSTDGLTIQSPINLTDGHMSVETTHLTVFRLGVPRGHPPLLHDVRPAATSPQSRFVMLGQGVSPSAAQNVLTLGGAYVMLALDASSQPHPLDLSDSGETLILQDASGHELDQAQLSAAPSDRRSWTRQHDGDPASSFVAHPDALFSPGTPAAGGSFAYVAGVPTRAPAHGELVINEVLLAPPDSYLGDANGDGEMIPLEDEFIELVNTTTHPLDLSGCLLLTNEGERHRFPDGTILPGGMAVVVFGVEDSAHPPQPAGPFGGARLLPDVSTALRAVARLPDVISPGTTLLNLTTFRQTSNPLSLQVLTRLPGQLSAFQDGTEQLPSLILHAPRLVRVADLDRDLDLDLVAVDGASNLLILINDGFGRFTNETQARAPLSVARNQFFDLALVDLTEDGAPEILLGDTNAAGSYTQLIVLNNNGGGYFEALSSSGTPNTAASVGPTTMDVGDVDGDGDLDVIVGVTGDQPLVFRNDGSDSFTHQPGIDILPQTQVAAPTHVELTDVDNDGDVDVLLSAGLAGLGSSSALQLFVNNGTGQFEDRTTEALPHTGEGIDALAVGDVDGDGDLDVIGGDPMSAVRLYLNDGTGHFTDATAGHLDANGAHALELGDLEGDGDLDLVVAKSPRDEVLLNDGTGHFTPVTVLPELSGDHLELLAADVDNDGDLDVVSVGSGVHLLLNAGTRLNHPPQLDAIAQQIVSEGNLLQFDVHATDTDGDPITLSATLPSGQPLSSLGASFTDHGDGQGTFGWTPTEDQGLRGGKLYEIVVHATDGIASNELIVQILVHDFNRPPTLDPVEPLTVEELVPVSIQLHASDPDDGDSLTFGAAGLPSGASLNSTTGLFQWTPSAQQGDGPSGQLGYPITFTVTDLAQATASQSVTLTVLNVNHAPVFSPIGQQQVSEGTELVLSILATDPDGDAVTWTAIDLPQGATFDANTHQFRWTPGFLQARPESYVARFEATDGHLTSQLDVSILVTNVNRPPQFIGLIDQTMNEGELLEFTVQVQDLDGDPLTVSVVEGLPQGATFSSATRQFSWTPDLTQAGTYPITFEVNDGLVAVHQSILVTVLNATRPPILAPIDDRTIREGDLLQIPIQASDPDGEPLTVTVEPLPAGALVIQQAGAFFFQWVPGTDQQGAHPLTVRVSDGTSEVTDAFTITVVDNPGFQRLVADVGIVESDTAPEQTAVGRFGEVSMAAFRIGTSLGLDLGEVHPALVSNVDLFKTTPGSSVTESDLAIFVSDDNVTYRRYEGPLVFSASENRVTLSNLRISERFIKIHRASGPLITVIDFQNFLPQIARASGAIPLDQATSAFLDEQGRLAFLYFAENVNENGLVPDRVGIGGGQAFPSEVYSTAATGFWLASLPMAVEHGWLTREQAEAFARRTLEFYLGRNGGPVAGQFGFYFHFLNADGTRFTQFDGDGISIIDSTLLFLGGVACGEYFQADIKTLATELLNRADWDAFYDHAANKLHLFWTPEEGFIRTLDYYSEGILSYLLAAGSTTHPIQPDNDLATGADAYYAFSQGNFGRILGRFGTEGRPLLQSFFGSLFTYLYPPLFVDLNGLRDTFDVNWDDNSREAILANFRFAQTHPEFGYNRLFWGISASDGPFGYQGLYGTPPLDPGAFGERHDGTIAPYALAGSLPFAADLALPALQSIATLEQGRLLERYGMKDGVNILREFFGTGYLGIDRGALLLGIERYRSGLIAGLVRQSAVMQRAIAQLGFHPASALPLVRTGPRSAHAYLLVDTTDHLTQTIQVERGPEAALAGDYLLELHPYGMDNTHGDRFVDVEVSVNSQFVKIVRFRDRRGDGTVDVGSVYVPIAPALLNQQSNAIALTWVGGERWVQLQDVELSGPTGRRGSQETWQIGQRDGSFHEFGNERLTDDSYLVGDPSDTFEQALNVVDEPMTDILFELNDAGADRLLRLVASETQDSRPVTVEVSINDSIAGEVTFIPGAETTLSISHLFLREGWNHIVLRHAGVPGEGQFILWDTIALERETSTTSVQVILRNVTDDQVAPTLAFGFAPPEGAVLAAQQYLEIHFETGSSFGRITISTDNRNALIHRFTGPVTASAAGLIGTVDSTITAPLLWQVYDDKLPGSPPFTDTVEWAYIPDASDADFGTQAAIDYRTLISRDGLGTRPTSGRSGSSPIIVYLVVDFRGKPAQEYSTDRLIIERFEQ